MFWPNKYKLEKCALFFNKRKRKMCFENKLFLTNKQKLENWCFNSFFVC